MSLGAVQALISAVALFAIRGGASAIVLIVVLYAVAVATAIALLEADEGTEPPSRRPPRLRSPRSSTAAPPSVPASPTGR